MPPPETLTATPLAEARSILVVEDEVQLRRLVQRLLEGAGYRVRTAGEGRAALAALDQEPADLVLLDYKMPVLDGAGFLEEARRRGLAVPVILVTASPEARHLADQFRGVSMLPKPFATGALLAAVARELLAV
jgi:two-component system, NarL family, sensor histidine kinase EvgS